MLNLFQNDYSLDALDWYFMFLKNFKVWYRGYFSESHAEGTKNIKEKRCPFNSSGKFHVSFLMFARMCSL